jgi:2-C-methyl-D-erythritol 2,4-cyclodiphosphate synthase
MLTDRGWRLVNLDLTIACELPRINPHVAAMREVLAGILKVPVSLISVKATTTEKLGFCGRGEGIAALAVVLVQATE